MDTGSLQRFFDDLRPRLEMAQEMDARLNRRLAFRFNVLDYIRTSELGLSRVIADLLNPQATHGQGILFLKTLLCGLQRSSTKRGRPLDLTLDYGTKWEVVENTVRVKVERTIPSGRRLDISVEFEDDGGRRRCLAIENKPYAGDQKDQVRDYLDFMEKEYGSQRPTSHLLIYLSRTGQLPSERSIGKDRLDQETTERDFAVMGYSLESVADSGSDEPRGNGVDLLLDYSLRKWFDECRKECDVEHLRNFLRDGDEFCRRRFSGVAIPDAAQDQILQFLVKPENMRIAKCIAETLPKMREHVKYEPFRQIRTALYGFCESGSTSSWKVREPGKDRLVLFKDEKGHWSSRWKHSGVWLHWMEWKGTPAWGVGVEGTSSSDEEPDPFETRLRSCYPNGDTIRGGDTWFYGWPHGEDWVGWNKLLAKSDEGEIQNFARATVDLMKELVRVIDDADVA